MMMINCHKVCYKKSSSNGLLQVGTRVYLGNAEDKLEKFGLLLLLLTNLALKHSVDKKAC